MIKKLKCKSGESFIESLTAVLIMSITTALFIGLVMGAKNINMQQKAADERFYAAMRETEAMTGSGDTVSVEIHKGSSDGELIETISCDLTSADNLRSYKMP